MLADLLRRIIFKTADAAKWLILLVADPCRESGQGGRKRDRTSVSGRGRGVTHKVFHRRSGKTQKDRRIIDLRPDPEKSVKMKWNAR
jgi:hypothetical protein